MSIEKVDAYKNEKANRKQTLAKEKVEEEERQDHWNHSCSSICSDYCRSDYSYLCE